MCVNERGPFMPSSSVFVELMICAFYGPKYKHAKKNLEERVLFHGFGFFDAFN